MPSDARLPFPESALRAGKGSRWRDWQIDAQDSKKVSLKALDPGGAFFRVSHGGLFEGNLEP